MAKHAQEIEGSKYEELIAENEAFYADIKAKLSSLSFGARDDNEEADADNVEHEQQQHHSSTSREDSSGSVEEGDEDSEEETHQQGGAQEEDSNQKTKKKKKKGRRLRKRLSLRKHKHAASAVAQ
jgi:hypothetical protein